MKTDPVRHIFGIAGGSVIGSEHAMLGRPGSRNNQDALNWVYGRNCIFAVVCDGCSKGAHSEIGSQLISRILSRIVINLADAALDANPAANLGVGSEFWKRVEQFLLNDVLTITRMIGGSLSQTITDFWLSTIVGVLITPDLTYIVAVGDGFYAVNGEEIVLKPEAGNSPAYIAYQISGTTLTVENPEILHLRVHDTFATDSVESIILASDGVQDLIDNAENNLPGKAEKIGSVHQFSDRRFFTNPDNVRRRLALTGLETVSENRIASSPLKDYTTVITILRKGSTSQTSE